jgi:SAM-dependent methyltransferase
MAHCEHQQPPQDVSIRRTPELRSDRPTGKERGTLRLPAYAQMLGAYHRAFARELRAMLSELPLTPGHRVLDLACGDGSYARWMAPRIAPTGHVIAVDLSREYLTLAQHHACAGANALRPLEGRRGQALSMTPGAGRSGTALEEGWSARKGVACLMP